MKINAKKIGVIVAVVLVAVGIGFFVNKPWGAPAPVKNVGLPERNDTVPAVPFLYNYGTKIVYTTNTTIDKEQYSSDCSVRGGVFNVCGNTCEPDADVCSSVCALTCEAPQE